MKRRDFVGGMSLAIGVQSAPWFANGAEPCPPESSQVSGGTSATTACPPPLSVSVPSWLQGRGVNEWFQIPNTAMSSSGHSVPGLIDQASMVTAWCGAALRRSDSTYIVGAAGGHGDYFGNDVRAITLGTNPSWTRLRDPTPLSQIVNNTAVYLDWRRSPTHTYNSTQFMNQDDKLLLLPCPGPDSPSLPRNSAWQSAYPQGKIICAFDMATNDWDWQKVRDTNSGTYADWPANSGDFTACLAVMDPLTGNMWYTRNGATGGLWKYTKATNSWASTGNSVFNPNYCGAAYDFVRDRMLIVGTYEGIYPPKVHSGTTGAQVSVTFTGLGAGPLTTSGYPNVTYDEYNDRFLVFKNSNPIAVYAVDPSTWDVQLLSTMNAPPSRQNGLHNAIQYVPNLKCVVMQLTYGGAMWCMRLG